MANPLRIIGNKILRDKTDIIVFPDPELEKIAESLFVLMYRFSGAGLAANQVGINKRMAVVDARLSQKKEDQIVLINPEIIESSGEQDGPEGCLSIPGLVNNLKRPEYVKVKTFDFDGKEKTIEAHGLTARVFQHEIDHLDGILFVDKLTTLDKMLIKGKLKKIASQFKHL